MGRFPVPQDHPEPLKGGDKPLETLDGQELGQEGGSRKGLPDPLPLARPSRDISGVMLLPCLPPRPLALAAFVFQGLHKMAATALRHFVTEAGSVLGRGEGSVLGRGEGREGDPCSLPALVAWTEPSTSPACLALAMATPGLAQPLGRVAWESWPLTQPCQPLATAEAGCTPEPGSSVPEAMLREGLLSGVGAEVDGSRSGVCQVEGLSQVLSTGAGLFQDPPGKEAVPSGPHLPLHTTDLTGPLGSLVGHADAGVPQWSGH